MCSHPLIEPAPPDVDSIRSDAWPEHVRSDVLAGVVRVAASVIRAPLGVLTLGGGAEPRVLVQRGFDASAAHGWEIVEAESLCDRVVAENRPVMMPGVPALDLRIASPVGSRWALGVPVRVRDRAAGALVVLGDGVRGWSEDDLEDLFALAEAASAELERARLTAERHDRLATTHHPENRYARFMQASYIGVFAADAIGRITDVNETVAGVMGRSRGELLGMDFRSLIAPEDRDYADRLHAERLLEVTESGEVELRVIRPTGERRLLQVWASPLLEDGRATGTYGVLRDITDERAKEMQFRRAERMAGVAPLLSGVCHELNNPLTSIKSFAELLLLDARSPEDREALEIVRHEAHRAAKIVTDLRMAAAHGQESSTGHSMVALGDIVRRVVDSRCTTLAGMRVHLDLADGLPAIHAIRPQIEQVVSQLIANAVQAMDEQTGPRDLTVRTYAGGMGVVLQVEDSGPGIFPDHLDRIFDPFWTTRDPGKGAGLGLSLVHGIVTDHGGRIRVNSSPGQGTGFFVELPAARQKAVSGDGAETNGSAARSLRILVVDDEAAIRYSLTRYLERRGHLVHQAADGAAALGQVDEAETPYDVIVADLRMPGLNGGDLLRRLRDRSSAWDDRLIFITGDADHSDLRGGLDEAGIPLVQKPFELAEMAQIIETQAGITAL